MYVQDILLSNVIPLHVSLVVLPSFAYQLTSGVRTFKIIINKGGTTQYGDVCGRIGFGTTEVYR